MQIILANIVAHARIVSFIILKHEVNDKVFQNHNKVTDAEENESADQKTLLALEILQFLLVWKKFIQLI